MSYFAFCKQILLHPIAFLDQCFVSDKTTEEFKKKTWLLVFKLWVYLSWILSGIFVVVIFLLSRSPYALLGLAIPPLFTIIWYVRVKLSMWFFHKCMQWTGLAATSEKSNNLFLYRFLAIYLRVILTSTAVACLSELFFSFDKTGSITTLLRVCTSSVLFIYSIYLGHKLVNKATTGISLPSYILYFVLFTILAGILLALAILAIIVLILYAAGLDSFLKFVYHNLLY